MPERILTGAHLRCAEREGNPLHASPPSSPTQRCRRKNEDLNKSEYDTPADHTNAHHAGDVGILVVARVRPFTRREWEECVGVGAVPNPPQVSPRPIARGPWIARQEDSKPQPQGPPFLSPNPEAILEIEPDGRTLVLLEPASRGASRVSFNFEHVFSSLALGVELTEFPTNRNDCPDRLGGGEDTHAVDMSVPSRGMESEPHRNPCIEAEQERVFAALGEPVVEWSLRGFNACIFAYGQTGSGKTHTMVGSKGHDGIIPRLCRHLFCRLQTEPNAVPFSPKREQEHRDPQLHLESETSSKISEPTITSGAERNRTLPPIRPSFSYSSSSSPARLTTVSISFMEIYNEKVCDLLHSRRHASPVNYQYRCGTDSSNSSTPNSHTGSDYQALKVRQHPLHGPFVEGLTTVQVRNWEECQQYIHQGNAARVKASTSMNDNSSRSHVIFQMIVTQTESLGGRVRGRDVTTHRVSKINLVDLAGSERSNRLNATGRSVAGTNSINLSLSALRRVIDALVRRQKAIPYRESLLTYVLSDNFGGNSRTVMCATLSPHISNYAETESTLRYASLARDVVNRVRINEHPSAKVIRELKDRMRLLQEELQRQTNKDWMVELEEDIRSKARAIDELRQREEELLALAQESKERECRLLQHLQSREKQEEMWRNEAHRQQLEKEKLRNALRTLVEQKPELVKEGVIRLSTDEAKVLVAPSPPPKQLTLESKKSLCNPEEGVKRKRTQQHAKEKQHDDDDDDDDDNDNDHEHPLSVMGQACTHSLHSSPRRVPRLQPNAVPSLNASPFARRVPPLTPALLASSRSPRSTGSSCGLTQSGRCGAMPSLSLSPSPHHCAFAARHGSATLPVGCVGAPRALRGLKVIPRDNPAPLPLSLMMDEPEVPLASPTRRDGEGEREKTNGKVWRREGEEEEEEEGRKGRQGFSVPPLIPSPSGQTGRPMSILRAGQNGEGVFSLPGSHDVRAQRKRTPRLESREALPSHAKCSFGMKQHTRKDAPLNVTPSRIEEAEREVVVKDIKRVGKVSRERKVSVSYLGDEEEKKKNAPKTEGDKRKMRRE